MRLDYEGPSPQDNRELAKWLVGLELLGVIRWNGFTVKWERLPNGTLRPYVVTFGWSQGEQEPATLPEFPAKE